MKREYFIPAGLFILDEFLKLYFRHFKVMFEWRFLSFKLSTNTGALFGAFQNTALTLAFLSLTLVGFILLNYDKLASVSEIAVNLILSGLISNMLGRFFLNYVTDYICFSFWPCFNLADAMVVVGVALLTWKGLKTVQ